nr:flagellar hook-associated protein FlgK [Lachnospira sp.]
ENMVNGYDNQRTETTGVSSDEELQKMIKFQHAYNASSRYVNVVSEMLEHLVTSLGAI